MPHHVVKLVSDRLNDFQKSVKGSKILVLGMAYKPDISDQRESPSIDVFKLLAEKGAKVDYNDPHIPQMKIGGEIRKSLELTPSSLAQQDLVVITTNHAVYDVGMIVENAKAIVDTRNATKGINSPKIVRL
jgi:UDP-N-acetyl-D-glucosamine dehydrogenase